MRLHLRASETGFENPSMKQRRKAALGTILAGLLAGSTAARASSNDQAWRQDIAALHDGLPAHHVDLFFKMSRETWDAAAAQLTASVPGMRDYEVVVGIMKLVTMVGDAHTAIQVGNAGFRTYPLRLAPFSGGLYVTGATAETATALGMRLVAIGNTVVEDAVAAVGAIVPHQNDAWLRVQSPQWLTVAEVLAALGLAPDSEHASFLLEGPDGRRRLDLAPMLRGTPLTLFAPDPAAPAPAYRRNLSLNYWHEYDPVTRTLLIEYNRCVPMASPTPEEFSRSLLAAANANTVSRVVIDLRNNGGGDSSVINRLVADLYINRPDLAAPGTFYGIIGNGTFSAAMTNAFTIRVNGGLLYGEPTGGRPNGYGNVATFALPISQFQVQYSTKFFKLLEDDPDSIDPDVFVPVPFEQYLAGRDPVLEAIVNRRSSLLAPPRRGAGPVTLLPR